jgi:hypothetical protein
MNFNGLSHVALKLKNFAAHFIPVDQMQLAPWCKMQVNVGFAVCMNWL